MENIYLGKSNKKKLIKEHTEDLLRELRILKAIYPHILNKEEWEILELAIKYHDIGKINSKFQNKNNLLFSDSRGNPIQPNLINRKFKTICKNAQIRPTIVKRCINQKEVNTKSSDTNFHMCRHTFATRCIECGIDVIVLSKLLGHSKIETTLNVYIDVFDQYRNKNLENLNNYYKENKIHFKIS